MYWPVDWYVMQSHHLGVKNVGTKKGQRLCALQWLSFAFRSCCVQTVVHPDWRLCCEPHAALTCFEYLTEKTSMLAACRLAAYNE